MILRLKKEWTRANTDENGVLPGADAARLQAGALLGLCKVKSFFKMGWGRAVIDWGSFGVLCDYEFYEGMVG